MDHLLTQFNNLGTKTRLDLLKEDISLIENTHELTRPFINRIDLRNKYYFETWVFDREHYDDETNAEFVENIKKIFLRSILFEENSFFRMRNSLELYKYVLTNVSEKEYVIYQFDNEEEFNRVHDQYAF